MASYKRTGEKAKKCTRRNGDASTMGAHGTI